MCWSRKGVPGSKRSGEAGTPFLEPAAEPNFRSERAAGWSIGWSAYRGPPNGPPQTNKKGAWEVPRRSRAGRESSRRHRRPSIRAAQRRRGVRGTVFSPSPTGRLVRQPPIGVVRRRALLSCGSLAPEAAASVESRSEPRARPDEWFSSVALVCSAPGRATAFTAKEKRVS
jgi:hypothetical protein